MKELDDKGVVNLICAVVKQAVQDWRNARRRLRKNPANRDTEDIVRNCERFFRSEYFENLTGMDGGAFLKRLKEQEEKRVAR